MHNTSLGTVWDTGVPGRKGIIVAKISKFGDLNMCWDLEKAEEPEIKLLNHQKSKSVPEKHLLLY